MISTYFVLAGILTLNSCATNRGYNPAPRMGAEYRFEEGLRKEKKPQYLFDKKTRKEMAKMGYPTGERSISTGDASTGKPAATTPQAGKTKALPVDSMRMDTVYKVRPQ